MKRSLFPDLSTFSTSIGLLLLRLVFGGAMIQHGWGKIQTPTSWMGPGAPAPGFLQLLAAVSEFGGGIALVLGLLTPLAMLGWIVTMGVAVVFVASKGAPWVSEKPGGMSFEPALGYLAVAVLFLLAGPGRYSLDALLLSRLAPKGSVRAASDA